MISRRILRIKALQVLYAHSRSGGVGLRHSETELGHSIGRAYDLYHMLLLLLQELQRYADNRITIARHKHIPTPEEKNPNTRFVDNPLLALIEQNQALKQYVASSRIGWVNHPHVIRQLYQRLIGSDYYADYMQAETIDFAAHRQLLVQFLTQGLAGCEDLEQGLEELSIYWVDDLEFMVGMAAKTLKGFTPDQPPTTPLLPMFKNPEDETFAQRLLVRALEAHPESIAIIGAHAQNWDVERIAVMDTLIMELAIAEILHFPSIPVKVSFNEYIEISKYYSTPQSSVFINGVLDKIIQHFRESGRIQKQGRGLLGEE